MDRKLLSIYLNDHLAGSTAGVSLARRIADSNRGNRFGIVMDRLANEISDDRDQLVTVMSGLGVKRNRLKIALGGLMEHLGRFKLNGSVTDYSPLSRLVELEGMALGVTGQRSLWRALRQTFGDSVAGVDIADLEKRADDKFTQLEQLRLDAAELAFRADLDEDPDKSPPESTKATGAVQPPS